MHVTLAPGEIEGDRFVSAKKKKESIILRKSHNEMCLDKEEWLAQRHREKKKPMPT